MAFDRSKVLAAAQKYLAKGQHDKAIAEYRKLVQRDPKDLRTWLKIGDLCARTGSTVQAVQAYERVACHYAEQGFHVKAVAVYKQILQLVPDRIDVEAQLAEAYEELQLVNEAMRTYERVAAHHARAGETERMLNALRRMADLEPEDVAARIKLAEALSKAGRREDAAEQFEVAASLLLEEGREDDYLKVAERLLYHRPGDAALALDLARRYLARQEPKRSLPKLQVCFKANPRDPNTLDALATAFEQLGQAAKSVSVLRELARLHERSGDTAARRATLERILSMEPGDPEARRALDAMAPARSEALSPEPSFTDSTVVESLSDSEEIVVEDVDEEEIELLEGAEEFEDVPSSEGPSGATLSDAEVERLLSECDAFARYGLHERIVEAVSRVLATRPDDMAARERLKDAYLALGRTEEAIEQLHELADRLARQKPPLARLYLRRILELKPEDERARTLLGLPSADALSESGARPAAAPPPFSEAGGPASPSGVDPLEEDEPALATEEHREPSSSTAVEAIPAGIDDAAFQGSGAAPSAEELERAEAEALQRASVPPGDIEEALDEAEFFLAQGLLKEARATLEEALEGHPDHPLLLDRLRELSEDAPGEVPAPPGSKPGAYALAERLAAEAPQDADDLDLFLEGGGEEEVDVAADFERFKQEVDQTIGEEDVDTHFDLGIAYREMGLLEAAMDEFSLCAKHPEREAAARAMLGICYLERGEVSEAIAQFKKGLYAEQKSAEEELGLYYELGNAYDRLGDTSEALYYFEKVYKREATFRDVADRVSKLRGAGGTGEGVAVRDATAAGDEVSKASGAG